MYHTALFTAKRPGTPATYYKDNVEDVVKKEKASQASRLAE